jgi:hypothetical protein
MICCDAQAYPHIAPAPQSICMPCTTNPEPLYRHMGYCYHTAICCLSFVAPWCVGRISLQPLTPHFRESALGHQLVLEYIEDGNKRED